jgi:hypothetical protein
MRETFFAYPRVCANFLGFGVPDVTGKSDSSGG